jgi:Initiator Rep protein, WH2/Initiator Replication protein, WH1
VVGVVSELKNNSTPSVLKTLSVRTTGDPLDPDGTGSFIKPAELVDAVEISALNRSELILYNQLLANAWNDIEEGRVYSVRKSQLRGSHDSNDRLHDSFDRLMGAFAKVKYRDPATGQTKTVRISLLGPNVEEDNDDGCFHYTFHPSLLTILESSRTWARLKSEVLYLLRSKYSIRLYELIERRINMRAQSETFTVPQLRGLLGVPKGKLNRFADFNSQCLKTAVGEVNHLTDYEVSLALIKRGRSVEQIRITWLKKCDEAKQQAAAERKRSRIGRVARRKATVEVVL